MVDRSVRDRFDLVFGRLASLFAAWPFLNSSFFLSPTWLTPWSSRPLLFFLRRFLSKNKYLLLPLLSFVQFKLPLKYSLYCVVQNSSLSHASTLQTRPKNSHSVYIDGRDTNLFFELLSLICVTRARVFIFIAFTKAATRENLVRWRTDLHNYQEQNRLLRVVPGVYKKEEEKKRGEEFSNR